MLLSYFCYSALIRRKPAGTESFVFTGITTSESRLKVFRFLRNILLGSQTAKITWLIEEHGEALIFFVKNLESSGFRVGKGRSRRGLFHGQRLRRAGGCASEPHECAWSVRRPARSGRQGFCPPREGGKELRLRRLEG